MGSPFHRLVHGRSLRWVATLVLAVLAGTLAAAAVQRAEQARTAYGELRLVPVATTDLDVGVVITDTDLTWSELPAVLVADGVASDPAGRTVIEPIGRGEVVLDRRLAGEGAAGAAALVAPGRRAIAVPIESTPPGLAVGDRVEAYGPASAGGSLAEIAKGQATGARRVARDAVVVAVDDRSATVSVSAADAPGLAAAVLDGALALALVAPG